MSFVWSSFPPKDAGVVGIPDEDSGEVPRAFIVRAPGSTITGPHINQLENEVIVQTVD